MPDAHREDIEKLESLYAEHPEGRIFTHLAEAYRKAGELDRAAEVLASGLERHPEYSSAHVVLGRVLVDQGRSREAEHEFERVLQLDPHNLVALRALGDLAREDGRRDEALERYQRLLEMEPSDDQVRAAVEELAGAPAADEPTEYATDASHDYGGEYGGEYVGEISSDSPADAGRDEGGGEDKDEEWQAPWEAEPSEPADDAEEIEPAFQQPVWTMPPVPTREGEPESEAGSDAGPDDAGFDADDGDWVGAAAGAAEAMDRPHETADEDAPPPSMLPGVMTETIAQVYARQGLYDRAAEVYRELLRSRPGDSRLREQLEDMERQASASQGEPGEHGEPAAAPDQGAEADWGWEPQHEPQHEHEPEPLPDEAGSVWVGEEWTGEEWTGEESEEQATPYAWAEPEPEPEPDDSAPIRSYFQSLLSWSPGRAGDGGVPAGEAELAADTGDEPGGADPASPGPTAEADAGEDDDDLEMFRSWLENLKQ
jgi:tetratricopeptide (TPR) repeat protein